MKSRTFYSNRLETLLDFFRERLGAQDPFQRQTLVVPSEAMKQWVYLGLASQSSDAVAMGLEPVYLAQALKRLGGTGRIPSKWELSFAIEQRLRSVLVQSNDDEIWAPLKDYLLRSSTEKQNQRLVSISDYLAMAFRQYSVYAHSVVEQWVSSEPEHWQQALWKDVFTSHPQWTHEGDLMKQLSQSTAKLGQQHFHLFAFPNMPKSYWKFFCELGERCELSVYLLSPCQAFWTDIRSDRECLRLQDYWRWRGAQQEQQRDLEIFLSDRNPLLANFGRLGREMAELVESADIETTEAYVLPDAIAEIGQYADFFPTERIHFSEAPADPCLLEAMQADLLLMRNPDSDEKIPFHPDDSSVQVHVFPSRYREVQGLYDTLLGIFSRPGRDGEQLYPNDVVVMTPDLAEYQAYVDAIFGGEESQIPYAFLEMPLQMRSSLVQGFLQLLDLAKGRWELKQCLELFGHLAFRRRHRLNRDDLNHYRNWLVKAGVRWGENLEHRSEILHSELDPDDPSGTWDFGFRRLIDGLALRIPRDQNCQEVPVEGLELGQAEAVGKLKGLFASLRSDLQFLEEDKELPVEQWCQFLRCLLESYFRIDEDNWHEVHDRDLLLKHIDKLQRAAQQNEVVYPFSSIDKRLRSALSEETGSQNENRLEAVRFCSLLPMRAVPAKVVVLLGLDDAAYPRKEEVQSLNLLKKWREADYSPSRIDFDRYLFLEAVMSARQHLIMSYQSKSDDKASAPSLLVSEMLSYMDRAYTVGGQAASEALVYKHPMKAFDPIYFSGQRPWIQSYSQERYAMAKAWQLEEKAPAHRFRNFAAKNRPFEDYREIKLQDLTAAAKNPMQLYFRKSLDLRIDDMELAKDPSEDPFHLTALQRSRLRRDGTLTAPQEVLDRLKHSGQRPQGAFGELAERVVFDEVSEQQDALNRWGLSSASLFNIEFSARCEQAEEQDDGSWILPAIKLNLGNRGECRLVGNLDLVSHMGLLSWGGDDLSDIWRVWPQYLVFCLAARHIPVVQRLDLLCIKTGKVMPELFAPPQQLLEDFLRYYLRCCEALCPLLAEWLPKILKDDEAFLTKDVREYWTSNQVYFFNQYAKWSLDSSEALLFKDLLEGWAPVVEDLILPFASAWYPKAAGGAYV